MHSYLHSKTRTFHWNFFAITPNLDAPHRRCCQNPVSTRHFGNNYRKVANSTHWTKTTTDYTLSPWCSCYHVCLTRIRSAVQVCVVTTLLFSWHLHNGFRIQSQNKNLVIRILILKENKGDESVQKTMKLSWHLPRNQTCFDESDKSYSEQNSRLRAWRHCKQNSAVNERNWQCTISISPSPVFSDCHVCLHAQTQ